MQLSPRSLLSLSVLALVGAPLVACGGEDDGGSGSNNPGNGTGGSDGSTTGGAPGTGGAPAGTGGDLANTGGTLNGTGGEDGTGTGGNPGNDARAYVCPNTFAGSTPTLPNGTAPVIATASGDSRFLEGPVWDGSALYVSHIQQWGNPVPARVLKLNGSTLAEFIPDNRAGTNGLIVRGDGKLVGASHRVNGLLVIDPAAPQENPQVLVNQYMGNGFNSPNDLTIRSDGTIYFTDPTWQCGMSCPQGTTRAYRVSPQGEVYPIDTPHQQPNGIALSLDESTLYIGGDNAGVYAYPVMADGSVGAGSVFANVTGADGFTLDCAGNLYVTANNGVSVYKPDGQPHGTISVGAQTTNVAFGGPERKTLYITTFSNNLHAVDLDIPGLPY